MRDLKEEEGEYMALLQFKGASRTMSASPFLHALCRIYTQHKNRSVCAGRGPGGKLLLLAVRLVGAARTRTIDPSSTTKARDGSAPSSFCAHGHDNNTWDDLTAAAGRLVRAPHPHPFDVVGIDVVREPHYYNSILL